MKKTTISLVLCLGLFAWGTAAYGCDGTIYSAAVQCDGGILKVQPKYQPGFDMNFDLPNKAFLISVNGNVLYTIDLRHIGTDNAQFPNSCGDLVSLSVKHTVLPDNRIDQRITVNETQQGPAINIWDDSGNLRTVTNYSAAGSWRYNDANSYQATANISGTGISGGSSGSGSGSGMGSGSGSGMGSGSGSGMGSGSGSGMGSGSGSGNTGIGGSGLGSGGGITGLGGGSGNGNQPDCSQWSRPIYGTFKTIPMQQGETLDLPNDIQWQLLIAYFNNNSTTNIDREMVYLTATLEGEGSVTISPTNNGSFTVSKSSPLKVILRGQQMVCGHTIDSSNSTEWGVQGTMLPHCQGPCKLTLQATTDGGYVMQPFVANVK